MSSSIILHQLLLVDYVDEQDKVGSDEASGNTEPEWKAWPQLFGQSVSESRRLFSVFESLNWVVGFPFDSNILFKLTPDGTNQLSALKEQGANAVDLPLTDEQEEVLRNFQGNSVFIAHSDDPQNPGLADEVQQYVFATTGVKPEMLQPTIGRHLWEEFERHAASCGAAICIWSPDRDNPSSNNIRPNVLLETGYFLSRLPTGNVIVIKEKDDLNSPSDLAGIVWATKSNWREQLPRALFEARTRRE